MPSEGPARNRVSARERKKPACGTQAAQHEGRAALDGRRPAQTRTKAHWHPYLDGGRRGNGRRAGVPAGGQYVSDIFFSPRQWKPYSLLPSQCDSMRELREKYGIGPMAIHSSYLVNLASATPEFHRKSVAAFRGRIAAGAGALRRVSGAAPGIVPRAQPGRRAGVGGAVDCGSRGGAGTGEVKPESV